MLNSCPDCDKYIRPDAFKCTCGWTKPSISESFRPHIDCAISGCSVSATVRLRKPTGWANFCVEHYVRDNVQEAVDCCADHGLNTTEKKIAHIKALLKVPKDPRAWMKHPKSQMAAQFRDEILRTKGRERVPGEDDEPMQEAA